jgi:ABC-2 type transport system ATP-binding protein
VNNFAIETNGLQKAFKGRPALDGMDLAVPRGSIFGFLGRNGAGKTTTIKVLMGLLRADRGEARVLGLSAFDRSNGMDIRRRVGTLPWATTGYSLLASAILFWAAVKVAEARQY